MSNNKKQISVSLPLNLMEKDRALFEPYVNYDLTQQKVKILKNVFVTNSGFCLNKEGLIKESHHDYPHQHKNYIREAATYYQDAVAHPDNLITLDDNKTYLLIHHPWYNYYHWMCEPIFRLWMVRERIDQMVLILPEFYKNADFIMGSLKPFKIRNIYFIPERKSLFVKNLCLPQIKPICDSYNAKHLREVRDFYQNYVLKENKMNINPVERLYVSRRLAGRRQIINEHEILIVLKKYGFTTFYPEKACFLDQVTIFSHVKYLVGIHGSGLTNMLFMEKGSSVLELLKKNTNELDHPSPLFWYMAAPLGINYNQQLCETYGKEDYYTGDYIVDVGLFEQNLIKMIN